jgi:hypothetical protein
VTLDNEFDNLKLGVSLLIDYALHEPVKGQRVAIANRTQAVHITNDSQTQVFSELEYLGWSEHHDHVD